MSGAELSRADREARVEVILRAARRIADRHDPLGIEARRTLAAATNLSQASIELALSRHIETEVAPPDLDKLVTRAGSAPRVLVVLSANVFTGIVRAVALAVAAAPSVVVRPSSREGVLAPLLLRAITDQRNSALFELATTLEPMPFDHVHVYGRRETIAAIRASCPASVTVRGHGPGFGIALVSADACAHRGSQPDLTTLAERLSWDIVPFDQRGCLSPRLAFVEGSREDAQRFAASLAAELEKRETEVPRGALTDEERSESSLYRQTLQTVGQCHEGRASTVGVDVDPRAIVLPPTGRHFHVVRVTGADEMARLLAPCRGAITCIGADDAGARAVRFAALAPGARILPLGDMQRPPLDGPVDLREML